MSQNMFQSITPEEALEMIKEDGVIMVDVRTPEEYNEGHIKGAMLLPLDEIQDTCEEILKDKNQKILVYCRSGARSQMSARILSQKGYLNIYDFGGIMDYNYEIEH